MLSLPLRNLVANVKHLADAKSRHACLLRGAEECASRLGIEDLRPIHPIGAAVPADDSLSRRLHIAVPVGPLAPRHGHDEAVNGWAHYHGRAEQLAGAPTAVFEHAVEGEYAGPSEQHCQGIEEPGRETKSAPRLLPPNGSL